MTSTATFPGVKALMSPAVEADHDDFGPGDFDQGLTVSVGSLEHDDALAAPATEAVARDPRRRLVNRCKVEAWYEAHPEIEALPVRDTMGRVSRSLGFELHPSVEPSSTPDQEARRLHCPTHRST